MMEVCNTLPDDLLKELKKLRAGQESLEKDLRNELSKRFAGVDFIDSDTAQQKDRDDLTIEKKKTSSKLAKIAVSISYFRAAANEAKDPHNKKAPCVIETVKKAMEEVESLISNFKESQKSRFNELADEENALSLEINAFDRKIDAWSRTTVDYDETSEKRSKPALVTDRDVTKDLPVEIAEFHRFVDGSGGQYGGWDAEDHEIFIKLWSDTKDDEALRNTLSNNLPVRSETEILDHIRWYRRYLELLSLKKEAISRWKEGKKLKQKQQFEAGSVRDREMTEQLSAQKMAMEEQERNDRRIRKQQLNAWRVERELDRLRAEERKIREETELQTKAEKNRLRQLEIKEQITILQEEKKKQQTMQKRLAEAEKRLEEQARKAQIDATRPKIELRNAILLEEKLQREKMRDAEKLERQQRIKSAAEKLKPQVPSDPYRVLRPTKVWEHRVRSAEPSVNRNVPPNFARIPHRAVPAWRQVPV